MATKNIVPNADTEGQLGTSTKGWGKIFLGGAAANIDVNNVSGTNTAGKSLTLISGASTGSGAGGSIVFQTAAAGGSGTSVNSHATVLTLDSAKLATFTGGLDIAGAVDIAGDLTLSAGADGALNFSAASSIKILDNSATSLVIEEADTAYMTFVTTNSSEAIKFDKALDINAAVQLDSTLTVGVNDTGYDVKFFGATSGKSLLWDESADSLIVTGTTDLIGTTNLDIVDIDGAVNIGAEVTLAAANKIIFNDASQFIHASSNAILNLGATDEIDLTATAIDVNGTMDVSGNATFASNIGIGGGALQSYHANVTSALALDDQSSIFTRSNQLLIANNFYYGASDAGLAIEDGKSSAIFYDRDQLRLYFAASANAGQASSLQEKLSVSETGLLTITDDLVIKTSGTIGGANDPDLLTLADQSLTVSGVIKQSGSTSLLTLNDSNSNSSGSSNILEMTDSSDNVLFKIAQISGGLNAEINQVVNGSLAFKTNNTAALTLDTSQNGTFAGALTVGTGNSSFGGDLFVTGDLTINSQSTASSVTDIDKIIFKKAHTSGAGSGFYNLGEIRSTTNGGFSGGMDFYFNKNAGSGSYTVTKGLSLSDVGDVTVSTGNLVIGTSGKGIDFSAKTPNEGGGGAPYSGGSVLNDYETGNWVPDVRIGSTENIDASSPDNKGQYVKIGRLVYFKGTATQIPLSGTGNLTVRGLPFTATSGEATNGQIQTRFAGIDSGGQLITNLSAGDSVLSFQVLNDSGYNGEVAQDKISGTYHLYNLSGFYTVDA